MLAPKQHRTRPSAHLLCHGRPRQHRGRRPDPRPRRRLQREKTHYTIGAHQSRQVVRHLVEIHEGAANRHARRTSLAVLQIPQRTRPLAEDRGLRTQHSTMHPHDLHSSIRPLTVERLRLPRRTGVRRVHGVSLARRIQHSMCPHLGILRMQRTHARPVHEIYRTRSSAHHLSSRTQNHSRIAHRKRLPSRVTPSIIVRAPLTKRRTHLRHMIGKGLGAPTNVRLMGVLVRRNLWELREDLDDLEVTQ